MKTDALAHTKSRNATGCMGAHYISRLEVYAFPRYYAATVYAGPKEPLASPRRDADERKLFLARCFRYR